MRGLLLVLTERLKVLVLGIALTSLVLDVDGAASSTFFKLELLNERVGVIEFIWID